MKFPELGEIFHGKYRLDEKLGEGGFAVVFRATDLGAGRAVAIKVLKPGHGGYSADTQARFEREVQVIANLRDPHTVTMFDFGASAEGLLFMVFEHVPGQDLSELLARYGRLPEDAVIHVMRQVLQSLREAHSYGLLHRDLKPENIRLFEYMGDPLQTKLLDFGIARPSLSRAPQRITQDGQLIGTPRYMSPEQLLGEPLTPASDLYSLGLVACEMLMGREVFQGNSWVEQLDRVRTGFVFAMPELDRFSPQLGGVIGRMIARDPAARFGSAEDVLRALDHVVTGEAVLLSASTDPLPDLAAEFAPSMPAMRPETLEADGPQRSATTAVEDAPSSIGMGLVAAAVVVLLALGFGAWRVFTPSPAPEPAAAPDPLAFGPQARALVGPATEGSAGLAPEGREDVGGQQNAGAPADASALPDAGAADAEKGPDAAPAASPEDGCGVDPPGKGTFQLELQQKGTTWDVHLPKRYDPAKRYPVVFLFHQDGRSGREFLDQTRFDRVADRDGIILMVPTQVARNLLGSAWVWRSPADVTRTHGALEFAKRNFCVDDKRVYAVGHAAGGVVTHKLACVPWIRAVAINSHRPVFGDGFCRDPKPIIYLSPLDSPRQPVRGGTPECLVVGSIFPLDHVEEKFREQNLCTARSTKFSGKECKAYECSGAPFVSCRFRGGHGWGGSSMIEIDFSGTCKDKPPKFGVTAAIWEFFESLEDG